MLFASTVVLITRLSPVRSGGLPVNYRPISLPPLLMKNNYRTQRFKPYVVERKTRVGRSAVGFGGLDSRGDSCRHYNETKLCIWHEYVLSVC